MNTHKTLVSTLALALLLVLETLAMSATIPAPSDVAKAPKDAIKTASGLKHKLIRKGTGTLRPGRYEHPNATQSPRNLDNVTSGLAVCQQELLASCFVTC